MSDYKLGEVETRFAELIWENEPLSSGELVKHCAEKLGWKKSTTYTVLKKLCDKGYFRNEDGAVTSLISREGMQAQESRRFVEDTFGGSLPAFFAAFTSERQLSDKEVADIRRMIDAYGKEASE